MDPIQQLKGFIENSRDIVVFTGAGISTESGISDYRSQGGIWERFQPVTIQEFLADEEKRKLYWQRKLALFEENQKARPNAGHKAIVELERRGRLRALITQNIDGLHQTAGTSPDKILELHGTNQEVICLSCRHIWPFEYSFKMAGACDLMLVLGSSLVVEPAASIPRTAKMQGAKLVIITRSETKLC